MANGSAPVNLTVGGSIPWNVPSPKTASSTIVGFSSLTIACVLHQYGINADPVLVGAVIVSLMGVVSHLAPHIQLTESGNHDTSNTGH